jgi:hypothetical protein
LVPPALVTHGGRTRQEDQREDGGACGVVTARLGGQDDLSVPEDPSQFLASLGDVADEARFEVVDDTHHHLHDGGELDGSGPVAFEDGERASPLSCFTLELGKAVANALRCTPSAMKSTSLAI